MKDFLFLIALIVLWAVILLNPVAIAIWTSNPLYLFLYLLLVPEIVVGIIISNFLIALAEL